MNFAAITGGSCEKGRKSFFFEKKNQKTFANCSLQRGRLGEFGAARNRQKFFASFFQKRSPLN
jgi:hypothetical protein